MDLLAYMTAFGLASGAGGRAAMVLFSLGLFHHTEYFDLAPSFAWIASVPVMAVLGVISIVELLADLHPDISELQDLAGYLPAAVSGFIAFAAATGDVDSSMIQLVGSGVLGGATATCTRFCRNQVSMLFRDVSDGTTDGVHKLRSHAETGFFAAMIASSFFMPVLVGVFLLVVVVGTGVVVARRRGAESANGS